jgi:hypothetical protein
LGVEIELEIVALPGVYLIILEDWVENGEWRFEREFMIPRTESTTNKPDTIDSLYANQ